MDRPYKRQRIFVGAIQYRLLALNLIYLFTTLLIFTAILFVPLMIQLGNSSLPWIEKQEAARQFLSLHGRVWPPIFALFALLAFHSVLVSHRIAGPLYRFRTIFKAIGEGNLSVHVALRKHDYLHREADSINEMITNLRTKIAGIEEQYGEMRAVLAELKRANEIGSVEETSQNVKSLEAQMERLKVDLNQFGTAAKEMRMEEDLANKVASRANSEDSETITLA
jgi:methyl-accepting chemotaxis protein